MTHLYGLTFLASREPYDRAVGSLISITRDLTDWCTFTHNLHLRSGMDELVFRSSNIIPILGFMRCSRSCSAVIGSGNENDGDYHGSNYRDLVQRQNVWQTANRYQKTYRKGRQDRQGSRELKGNHVAQIQSV